MTVWITSDWHFSHNADFIWKSRGFDSVDEMNAEIVKRHNEIVALKDEVYVLGDLGLGADLDKNKKLIESLNGNLHVLRGNHDTDARWQMYSLCGNIVELCGYAAMLKRGKHRFYLSHFPTTTSNYTDGKSLRTKILSIHGHTHNKNIFSEVGFNCCLDANNCYPWNIEEIKERFLAWNY